MKTRCLAFIGYGAIAQDAIAILGRQSASSYQFVVMLRPQSPSLGSLPEGVLGVDTLAQLADLKPDLVIEAAGQAAVLQYAPSCVQAGLSIMITSVGALADAAFTANLVQMAQVSGSRIVVPSGAVAALDYLQAVRMSQGQVQVVYESRKPVAAWHPELLAMGYDPHELGQPLVLFEGPADEAARKYPKNLNVAATLALAGVGMTQTRVRVVVDPAVQGNQHSIHVQSPLGSLQLTLENAPSPRNPKTSWIVAHSVAGAIERYFSPFVVA
jgi:aspartate dehydrogenase